MKLRKIPLEPLLQILTDLFDSGADFIDISGENNADGDELRDIIKITIKPEYMMDKDDMIEEIEMDYSGDYDDDDNEDIANTTHTQIRIEDKRSLSDEDIDNLI
jgi:hypothetical protein